jgi:hypothetical protein
VDAILGDGSFEGLKGKPDSKFTCFVCDKRPVLELGRRSGWPVPSYPEGADPVMHAEMQRCGGVKTGVVKKEEKEKKGKRKVFFGCTVVTDTLAVCASLQAGPGWRAAALQVPLRRQRAEPAAAAGGALLGPPTPAAQY